MAAAAADENAPLELDLAVDLVLELALLELLVLLVLPPLWELELSHMPGTNCALYRLRLGAVGCVEGATSAVSAALVVLLRVAGRRGRFVGGSTAS